MLADFFNLRRVAQLSTRLAFATSSDVQQQKRNIMFQERSLATRWLVPQENSTSGSRDATTQPQNSARLIRTLSSCCAPALNNNTALRYRTLTSKLSRGNAKSRNQEIKRLYCQCLAPASIQVTYTPQDYERATSARM